jgi:hypothetical protein
MGMQFLVLLWWWGRAVKLRRARIRLLIPTISRRRSEYEQRKHKTASATHAAAASVLCTVNRHHALATHEWDRRNAALRKCDWQ